MTRPSCIPALALIVAASLATGCGPFRNDALRVKQERSALLAQPFTPDGLTESEQNYLTYNCPGDPNVVPDYDWEFNGTGYYSVCPSKSNLADILVHGRTRLGGAVCVFAAEVAANGQVFAKPNVAKQGEPWVQCANPSADGLKLSFGEGIYYNSVFIVDAADVKQMSLCIQGGVYEYCPKNYSFGRFR
jgi:hypothetical protein